MSKEQIEEMADIIDRMEHNAYTEGYDDCKADAYKIAEVLYNAGYRKHSEWISVDERLPQVTSKYICCVKDKSGNTWTVPADWSLEMKMWFGEFGEIKNMVTHWMPLPEALKMKGGG